MSNIVVDSEPNIKQDFLTPDGMLISWILSKIQPWEDYRDNNFKDDWDEYYRLWRGKWSSQDKTRNSERSKLISPALQQSIEVGVAEITEAVFGKGQWFDIVDNFGDQDPTDAMFARKLLEEDFQDAFIQSSIEEIVLIGALYGTGIGKITVEKCTYKTIEKEVISESLSVPKTKTQEKIKVCLVPVDPSEFVIDPYATSIDDALGCAHITFLPKHTILQKQEKGEYRKGEVGGASDVKDVTGRMETMPGADQDFTKVTEYHGLVPKTLLENFNKMGDSQDEDDSDADIEYVVLANIEDLEADELVEAIITFSNDNLVLKATENKMLMNDRGFIAFQYDTVPNRFWGRGIAEKGYNAQKALDAELRGRIDAMSLTIHPMMAVDSTRLVKGTDLSVRPGKSILTNGDPKTILNPLNFGQVTNNTFTQSGELERMIQMATGSMDSAAPIGVDPRNATASGMSMMLSGAIKRSKRTLENIENRFIVPFLNKSYWRYIQFDPKRYPIADTKFMMKGSLGIMARELEQSQLANMLKTVPPDSPAYWMLIQNMYELSSIENKEEMIAITKKMLENTLNPQPDPVQQAEVQKIGSEVGLNQANAMLAVSKAKSESMKNGEGEILKAKLDAQIKSQVAIMEDKTKRDIAQMQAQNDLYIETLKAQNEVKIEHLKLQANTELKSKELEDKKELKKKEISIKRESGSTKVSVN